MVPHATFEVVRTRPALHMQRCSLVPNVRKCIINGEARLVMNIPLKVLVVEDSRADAELLVDALKQAGYEPS